MARQSRKPKRGVQATRLALPRRRDVLGQAIAAPMLAACAHWPDVAQSGVAELLINPERPRIAFGSCVHQEKDQSIWRAIAATRPDVFVMLGDAGYPGKASYATHGDVDAISQCYARLAKNPDFAAFSERFPILAIWDDNDFGASDAGGDYALKRESRRLFLDFWSRRSLVARPIVEAGVYCAFEFGSPGNRIQIILPDLRFNRSPWVSVDEVERARRAALNIGPYTEGPPEATFLGETQWAWLEQVLQRKADIRIFASSIQFASEGRGWECWANFPNEKRRLLALISEARTQGCVVISGDAHFAEVCRQDEGASISIWDITSSGLTESWPYPGPSHNRVGDQVLVGTNFGLLELDVAARRVGYSIRRADGSVGLEGALRI